MGNLQGRRQPLSNRIREGLPVAQAALQQLHLLMASKDRAGIRRLRPRADSVKNRIQSFRNTR